MKWVSFEITFWLIARADLLVGSFILGTISLIFKKIFLKIKEVLMIWQFPTILLVLSMKIPYI